MVQPPESWEEERQHLRHLLEMAQNWAEDKRLLQAESEALTTELEKKVQVSE